MSDGSYQILTEATVGSYVGSRPALAALVDPRTLDAREIGDGNLNLVFVCRDAGARSLVLKQSLPYVRVAGPTWPLTPDRSHAEARGLCAAVGASPTTSPVVHAYDAANHVIAMEDLSHLTVLRSALRDGLVLPGAEISCGRHVARMFFHTGRLTLSEGRLDDAVASARNTALCAITEALVFNEPYIDHGNNSFVDALVPQVSALRADGRARDEVARLEARFRTQHDALVHGDLHTGSVMTQTASGAAASTKVIDPEFCVYGPIAFDLGTLFANLMFARERASCLGDVAQAAWLDAAPARVWAAFVEELWGLWPSRTQHGLSEQQLRGWLDEVRRDTFGFAGCEAVRRVIGFAKVADLETLVPELHERAVSGVLATARRWLTDAAAASRDLAAAGWSS